MIGDIPVVAIMREPIIVKGSLPLRDVAEIMIKEKIPCVLVACENSNESFKIVTDENIIKNILEKNHLSANEIHIEDISSKNLVTISPDTKIEDAIKIMQKTKAKVLFIVDKGEIIGVITEDDIINIAPELISTLRGLYEHLLKIINEELNKKYEQNNK